MDNKTIHYCWFGQKEKPAIIKKCIESWHKWFPDYVIYEWNEANFDVNCNVYVKQAYMAKKYAFVSDYVRFWALEKYGGIYFDTDVEVVKDFSNLLDNEAFAGFETEEYVAPGLVLFAKNPHNEIMRKTREWYDAASFLDDKGERIKINVCNIFTNILKEYGFQANGKLQNCGGMLLYPKDYFCPFDDATGRLHKTENTYAIHWYAKSWMSKRKILRNKITRVLHRIFGVKFCQKIARRK